MSKIFKFSCLPRKVAAADDCEAANVSARAGGAQFKNRLFRLLPWSNKSRKTASGDKQQQQSQRKKASDASKKQAWGDSGSTPDSMSDEIQGVVPAENDRGVAINRQSAAMPAQDDRVEATERRARLDTPMPRDLSFEPAKRAENVRDLSRTPLAMKAQEAVGQARQQFAVPERQEDPMEKLEIQWAESDFANMSHEHQQQLRAVIGLPILPCPSHNMPQREA